MRQSQHPSHLELDRLLLGQPSAPVEDHVAACASCRSYVEEQRQELPIPPWLRLVGAPRLEKASWFARRRARLLLVVAPAMAAVALLVIVLLPLRTSPDAIVEKGGPMVSAFIKRGERVWLWDGRSPIRPGDLLRLEVASGGYRFISVASLTDEGTLSEVLFAGPARRIGTTPLPLSWRVDPAGTAERLSVVLANHSLDAAEHEKLLSQPATEPRDAFRTQLTFPKTEKP
jgi:hypothetical protein